MHGRPALLTGALALLLWVNVVASEWPYPYFLESPTAHENVEWESAEFMTAFVSIWEGTEGDAELMRLSYTGAVAPTVRYEATKGLGITVGNTSSDSSTSDMDAPFYLYTTEPGDYESVTSYMINVKAIDVVMQGIVTVNLVNINDNPPIIESPSECNMKEAIIGSTGCKFVVSDADGGACYADMTVDNDHFQFELDGTPSRNCRTATFVLIVVKKLDFETYRLHSLKITAEDFGQVDVDTFLPGEPFYTSVSFVVNVDDMPDEPPVWQTFVPSVSEDEKTAWSRQLLAVDGDFGLNWEIEYNLTLEDIEEKFHGYFSIDNAGTLRGKSYDRDEEKEQIFKIKVVATEVVPDDFEELEDFPDLPMSITSDIVILINDVNDHEPKIEPETLELEVDEEMPFTCKDFRVFDPDLADHGTFDLSLEDNDWSFNFLLIPLSGYQESALTITAENASLMDYEDEKWRHITLKIVATEMADKSHVTIGELVIILNDLNDEYPVFEKEEYNMDIDENQPEDTSVILTHATDADEGDNITYTIRNAYLKIDEEGLITTLGQNAFDYERQTEIILQVVAADSADQRSYCQVNITVNDLNDEAPTLVMPGDQYDVEEHTDVGERASYDITATDLDGSARLTIDINWDESSAFKQGVALADKSLFNNSVRLVDTVLEGEGSERVWRTYLEIADNDTFDWEVFDTMRLRIVVTDHETLLPTYAHNYQRSALLTVNVGDINDCAPVFTDDSLTATLSVFEEGSIVRLVGSMVATDDDGDGNNVITYNIRPVAPVGLTLVDPQIEINSKTGQMYTSSKNIIDAEQFRELVYQFEVTADDTKHYTKAIINITIIDINDCIPEVTDPSDLTLERNDIKENTTGSPKVGCIDARDDDMTDPYNKVFYILESGAQTFFEMVENCVWVIDGLLLDREVQPSHVMTIATRDNFEDKIIVDSNEGPTVTITVNLVDINDNPPNFEDTDIRQLYEDKVVENYHLFTVDVTDKDEGINADIECLPEPEVTLLYPENRNLPDGLFRVQMDENRKACAVYANKTLEYNWGIYNLVLTVTDKGEEPGPLRNTGQFSINVQNENMCYPEITYPKAGMSPIRLNRDDIVGVYGPLTDMSGIMIPEFKATDDDDPNTDNARVTMILEGGDNVFNVIPVEDSINTFMLVQDNPPSPNKRIFDLTVVAKDKALGDKQKTSDEVSFSVYVISLDTEPEFTVQEQSVSFSENSTGMEESYTLLEARNLDEELLENGRPIFYYIIGGGDDLFILDNTTRLLTLDSELDYEEKTEHNLLILASHKSSPETDYTETAVLSVHVEVIDINDSPPVFSANLYLGTFRADYESGSHILDLKAVDPDKDDVVTYLMVEGSMTISDPSLDIFPKDTAFLINGVSGEVTLNFSPGNRQLSGHFSFDVIAHDTAGNVDGHRDRANVKIYVVSSVHEVMFNFLNKVETVEENEKEMQNIFSEVFQYACSIDNVQRVDDGSGVETTNVQTHFFNEEINEPVVAETIEKKFLEQETYSKLYSSMQDLSLSFSGFRSSQVVIDEESSYLTIVLAAVCVVLAVLVVVFSLAFVVRTRTLNQRLQKLTDKKFGSQDSGLNRDSMTVPGTNRHALEGSNPVWNHEIDRNFDNMSQSSGDSDLIGIEDSPEFGGKGSGVDNSGFDRRETVNPFSTTLPSYDESIRRTSINPLAAAAMGDDSVFSEPDPVTLEDLGMPRRISMNPLAGGMDRLSDDAFDDDLDPKIDIDGVPSTSNFSFQSPEPTTEL